MSLGKFTPGLEQGCNCTTCSLTASWAFDKLWRPRIYKNSLSTVWGYLVERRPNRCVQGG